MLNICMTNRLDIVVNGAINPLFFKANRYLISKYYSELKDKSDSDKKLFLEKKWSIEFKAIPQLNNVNEWQYLSFFTESDKMMFLLKWES